MKFAALLGAGMAAGALCAGLAAAVVPSAAGKPMDGTLLLPDLPWFLRTLQLGGGALAALCGAAAGACLAVLLASTGRTSSPAHLSLAMLNPAFLYACLIGPQTILLMGGTLILAGALAGLLIARRHGDAVASGLAFAAAPFLSGAIIAWYPALFAASPLLSPWGLRPRRLAGLMMVLWSPFAMAMIGWAYLYWLLRPFPESHLISSGFFSAAYSADALMIAGGGAMIAVAARTRRPPLSLGLAGIAAALLIANIHPGFGLS